MWVTFRPSPLARQPGPCLDARAVNLRFEPVVPSDAQLLANFLAGSEWPFHHESRVDASWVRGRLEAGHFFGSDTREANAR